MFTLSTSVYEHDFRFVLSDGWIDQIRSNCRFLDRPTIRVFINNVNESSECQLGDLARKRISDGSVSEFVLSKHISRHVFDFFNFSKQEADRCYPYTIGPLSACFLCETEFLMYFTGDSLLWGSHDLADKSSNILRSNERILVVNPVWNNQIEEARNESSFEDGESFYGYGFSDQFFIGRGADFKKCIYNETHPNGVRFPSYGGNCFEQRVDAWMRNHDRLRATLKNCAYITKK